MNKENLPVIPPAAKTAARKDQRIIEICAYPDGWVANAYKYSILGHKHTWRKVNARWTYMGYTMVDRKKPYANGPAWVCFSKNKGRLASG